MDAVVRTDIPGFPCRCGKVRDVYDLGDRLVLVATDRISAFDAVLPTPIPGKGRLLTAMSLFWFRLLGVENHLLETDPERMGPAFAAQAATLRGRSMLVRKTEVVPIECVVRGYLAGSGWKEYQATRTVCGVPLPAGLAQAGRLPEPIFTPATKEESGHDENIPFGEMARRVGGPLAEDLRRRSLDVYARAAAHAASRGIILADTKLEWGRLPDGRLILIDEVLTPDSSRFWPAAEWREGASPPSFDKQYVRDWLEANWDKQGAPPALPAEVVTLTAEKYEEALSRLAGG
ncbi:MAG: phosphoribosylaminoimidazolesuccinocarboxamide synthase [Gemmataceae bacterium]|nr:phosphoribosylaminoimidazolesuccinocarboxamide synthase [Gemmataceae bacterium]